jgi:YD repeat-containing protein
VRNDAVGSDSQHAAEHAGDPRAPDGFGPLTRPVTRYAYDTLGRITDVTDALGNVTHYAYEDSGRRVVVTQPDADGDGPQEAPITIYDYDPAGHLVDKIDPLGRETSYDYDELGRLVSVTGPYRPAYGLVFTHIFRV